jgi:hypothetical protein
MKITCVSAVSSLVLALWTTPAAFAQPSPEKLDMATMMEKAKKFTQLGKSHELLHRFLGTWDTETRMTMPGASPTPEKGTSTCRWLMDGRWLQCDASGQMMGMPMRTAFILGYDNFKMSYVSVSLNSFDTAMIHSEGDLDPSGKALLMYGTLDEYLTGEHDKMVKSVFRFVSDDEMKLEVHDLPIGETHTQVFEIRYRRQVKERLR